MAQFDVHRNPKSKEYPLVVDLQADLLRDLATRMVAPLVVVRKSGVTPIGTLNPIVDVNGKSYVALVQEAAAVPMSGLGRVEGNLSDRRRDLIAAIDLLFTGI